MGKLGISARKVLVAAVVIAISVFGYRTYDRYRNRDAPPDLPIPDLNQSRNAGNCDRLTGSVFVRPMNSEDSRNPKISAAPDLTAPGNEWAALAQGAPFNIGTLFHLRPQSTLQLVTSGNWVIALSGEGEFIFEDARTNEGGKIHTNFWNLKKGVFRAKPHDYDTTDHWLQITTPVAKVFVHKGEIGLRVAEGGGGQIWLLSGVANVHWNDGRKKSLTLKGMEYL